MKEVKRKSQPFLTQFVSFLLMEVFFLTSVMPSFALPNTHLRTRSARDGGVGKSLSRELQVEAKRAKDGDKKVTDPLLSRYQEDDFFGTDEIPRNVPVTHADFFEMMVLERL